MRRAKIIIEFLGKIICSLPQWNRVSLQQHHLLSNRPLPDQDSIYKRSLPLNSFLFDAIEILNGLLFQNTFHFKNASHNLLWWVPYSIFQLSVSFELYTKIPENWMEYIKFWSELGFPLKDNIIQQFTFTLLFTLSSIPTRYSVAKKYPLKMVWFDILER